MGDGNMSGRATLEERMRELDVKGDVDVPDMGTDTDRKGKAVELLDLLSDTPQVPTGTQWEIFAEDIQDLGARIREDRIEGFHENRTIGVGIRVIRDGRQSFGYTSDLAAWREVFERTVRAAPSSSIKSPGLPDLSSTDHPHVAGLYDPRFLTVTLDELSELTGRVIQGARDISEKNLVTEGVVDCMAEDVVFISSEGYTGCYTETQWTCYAGVVHEGHSGSWFDTRRMAPLDVDEVVRMASEMAMARPLKDPEPGRYPVLLHPSMVSDLWDNTVAPHLTHDWRVLGRSRYADSMGTTIADGYISIRDSGVLTGGMGSAPFDREGIPGGETTLVEDGVLSGFISDHRWASETGDRSTGNASGGFTSLPHIGFGDLVIDAPKDGPGHEELLREMGTGIYAVSGIGAHTANVTTGDFGIELSNAWFVRDGEIEFALRSGQFSGNGFDMFEQVRLVGGKQEHLGGFHSPPILLDPQMLSN